MDQSKLQSLIEQVHQLSPVEQQFLIRSITSKNNDRPLTEKEKRFIEESKKHISELQKTNAVLKAVLDKYT